MIHDYTVILNTPLNEYIRRWTTRDFCLAALICLHMLPIRLKILSTNNSYYLVSFITHKYRKIIVKLGDVILPLVWATRIHEACEVRANKCILRGIHINVFLAILWQNVIKHCWVYKWRPNEIHPFLKYLCVCIYL